MRVSIPLIVTTTDSCDRMTPVALVTEGPPAVVPPQPARRPRPPIAQKPTVAKRGWRAVDAPRLPEVAEIGSRFLYVAEQGAIVRRRGTRVQVSKGEEVLLEVAAPRLQGVLLYGNVQVSTQCLRALLAEDVWVSLFGRGGQYRGRIQPPVERGGRLRRRQWERAGDPEFCLAFSRAMVRGKLRGALMVADAYAKNRAAESLGTSRIRLRECLARVDGVGDLATLRGIEGTAARAYFEMFSRWNLSDLEFPGRQKRGTNNPLNALLNLGYALLTRELEGLLESAGLDPTVGFYHQPDDDRPSLACDWVEEFRHLVVDRLVLNLINRKSITAVHFESGEDHRGVRMTADGLRIFSGAFDRAMQTPSRQGEEPGTAVGGVRATMLVQLARLLEALAGRGTYVTHLEADDAPSTGDVCGVVAAAAS